MNEGKIIGTTALLAAIYLFVGAPIINFMDRARESRLIEKCATEEHEVKSDKDFNGNGITDTYYTDSEGKDHVLVYDTGRR